MTRQVLTILRPKPAVQLLLLAAGLLLGGRLFASENVPHRYFAQWADLPEAGQFVFGLLYEESEAHHIGAKRDYRGVAVTSGGEYYGIDVNQGYLALQYGINDRWAADFNIG